MPKTYQVSRKFRLVASLPEGKTGKEALAASGGPRCDDATWIDGLGEARAGEQYLRCYAPHTQLSLEEWIEFKKVGGATYLSAHWKDEQR